MSILNLDFKTLYEDNQKELEEIIKNQKRYNQYVLKKIQEKIPQIKETFLIEEQKPIEPYWIIYIKNNNDEPYPYFHLHTYTGKLVLEKIWNEGGHLTSKTKKIWDSLEDLVQDICSFKKILHIPK